MRGGISGAANLRGMVVVLVATLAMAVALSGCGSVHAGTAVQVGDSSLSVSAFQSQVQDLVEKAGRQDVGASELRQAQRSLLRQYVDNQLIRVVARDQRVSVTGSQVSQVLAQIKSQRVAIPDAMLTDFARWVALERQLAKKVLGRTPKSQADQSRADRTIGDMLIKAGRRVGVQVNPRYGSWSAGDVVADGALVTPAPASPSPGQLPAG